jgi:DNA sulfur modification protein DndB
VIIVVPQSADNSETFRQKYRRLFSNLNRYARSMDQATNIIMDEDDVFAILTRKLVTEHPFFMAASRQKESVRIKTTKGENLKSGDSYFTSIETLYKMNIELLSSKWRKNHGWDSQQGGVDLKTFVRFRPSDELIDSLHREVSMYWNAILEEIPDLHDNPAKMRIHSLGKEGLESDETDHLLFWPIGQVLLCAMVRQILDQRLQGPSNQEPSNSTPAALTDALKGLGKLEWRLHHAPWKYFLLIDDADASGKWRMRNEERKEAVRIGQRIQQWILGLDELDDDGVEQLKKDWASRLIPAQRDADIDKMWAEVSGRQ